MMKKLAFLIAVVIVALAITLALTKAPTDPVAYNPPKKPAMTGVLAPNTLLQKAELLAKGKINGPEDVAVDDQGRVYGGTWEGKILRVLPDGKVETFADTGGRPMGMKFDQNGNLVVCDAYKGLLSVDKRGAISVLATSAEGKPFKFIDALDIGDNGAIYFTEASNKFDLRDYLYEFFESRPNGRFMSYDPATKQVTVLMKDLYFANGVAVSQNQDFVLVNETSRYRVKRYWLAGPKAGTNDIFIDNLPGFPDNLSSNGKGRFWLALITPRDPALDLISPYPFIKLIVTKLPKFAIPKEKRYGLVLSLNEQGEITQSLQDPSGEHLFEVTSAQEYGGYLYLGSLNADRIGKYKVGE
jgi:sugar lactone lactonase YvrE